MPVYKTLLDRTQPYNALPLLPPRADIETKPIMRAAILANRALAALKNKADRLPNQDVLISSIALTEAKDSSAIENIFTTGDLLYKANITPESKLDPNTKEVISYNSALWLGMELIKKNPLSTNIFIRIVQQIKKNSASIRNTTGTRIVNANGEIIYTPPEGENIIRDKLKNLEDFMYEKDFAEIDPIIKMAIMHYQFEAIHPFGDGNGRTGRIINILWLVQEGLLNRPILFLSKYFLNHRQDYYRFLNQITGNNAWEQWILYMLAAVEETANKTYALIDRIMDIKELYKTEMQERFPKIYSLDIVETIFSAPYFRLEDVIKKNPTKTRQTISQYLHKLSQPYIKEDGKRFQILQTFKQGRENIYLNKDFFDILNNPT